MIEAWFAYALISAVLWGVAYPMSEHVLKGGVSATSLMFIYAIVSAPFYGLLAYQKNELGQSLKVLANSGSLTAWIIATITAYMTANLMVFISIEEKNATLASLIEATYPLFAALFAYLIFREVQVNMGTLAGGLMIILGAVIIYRYS